MGAPAIRDLVMGGVRKTVTLPIYGEDGAVRQFTFEVPVDTEIPPNAFISARGPSAEPSPVTCPSDLEKAMLCKALISIGEMLGVPVLAQHMHIRYEQQVMDKLRGYLSDLRFAQDQMHVLEDKVKELDGDARGVREAHQNAQEDLASLRADFAAEVRSNQDLQRRLSQTAEQALSAIQALIERLP